MRHENVRIWSGGTVAVKRKTANIKESGQLESHPFFSMMEDQQPEDHMRQFLQGGAAKFSFDIILLR